MKLVWRFNLAEGVDEAALFAWSRDSVWASSARDGCVTKAYRLEGGTHAYCTEAESPDQQARDRWQSSAEFAAIQPFPGTTTLWGAQTALEGVVAHELP